ncbi:MAG: hypothetical protein ACI8Y4_000400, partial [Candidatus Poriferisodalaceae bacterium]
QRPAPSGPFRVASRPADGIDGIPVDEVLHHDHTTLLEDADYL